MSVRFESASSEYVQHTNIGTAGDSTWFVRFYVQSLPGAGQVASLLSLYIPSTFEGFQVHLDENGKLSIDAYDSGDAGPGSTTVTTGAWHTLWITVDQTAGNAAVNVYLDESTTAEVSSGVVTYSAATLRLTAASWHSGGDYFDGRLRDLRAWSVVRSPTTNFAAEAAVCNDPADATNILAYWPLPDHTDLTDHSAGSLDLTATGTLSTEGDPAVCSAGGGPMFRGV